MNQPKILLWDLETSPNIVTSWGLWVNGGLSHENIIQERTIICGSWKWLGRPGIYSTAIDPAHPANDLPVVKSLHAVLSQADAIVAHNGDQFDLKWFNTRAVYHGLLPIPPVVQIDTKKLAKLKFRFNSNRLDYLAQFFKIGKKIKTEFGLWKECMAGDQKALARMVRYNRHDIVLLEGVYLKLAPFIPAKINTRLFTARETCQNCGSQKTQHRGFSYTSSHKYQRLQCTSCGNWSRSQKAEKI